MQLKILLIRFSSMGDVVLTTPVIRAVKTQLNAEVHIVVKSGFASVLQNNPYIDKIHLLDTSLSDTIRTLREENFSLVIDLHKNLASQWITFRLGRKTIRYDKFNIRKWLAVQTKWKVLPEKIHLIDRYFTALSPLGVVDDGEGLDFFLHPEEEADAAERVAGITYQVLVLGATYKTKRIPEEKCLDVIRNSPVHTLLLGGKDVVPLARELAAAEPEKTIDYCGKISLGVSAALIHHSQRVITGDTGLMHIGAALKKEMIVVWGNTIPSFGMYPWYGKKHPNKTLQLEVTGLSCRPCSKLGFNQCPKGHFRCMKDHQITKELLYLRPVE